MPQLDDSDAMDRLRLIRSRRVGAVTFHRLMAEHGTAAAALAAHLWGRQDGPEMSAV